MHVKKLIIILTFLTSTFAFISFVQADGDHSNHSDISNAITNFQGNVQPSSHSGDHSTPARSGQQSSHSDAAHGDEGHGDENLIEETPPNYKVLGTFGLINFSFLSLGAILKIRKRKEKLYDVK